MPSLEQLHLMNQPGRQLLQKINTMFLPPPQPHNGKCLCQDFHVCLIRSTQCYQVLVGHWPRGRPAPRSQGRTGVGTSHLFMQTNPSATWKWGGGLSLHLCHALHQSWSTAGTTHTHVQSYHYSYDPARSSPLGPSCCQGLWVPVPKREGGSNGRAGKDQGDVRMAGQTSEGKAVILHSEQQQPGCPGAQSPRWVGQPSTRAPLGTGNVGEGGSSSAPPSEGSPC